MVLDFIQLIMERSNMHPSMLKDEIPVKEWVLTAHDRCDKCSAQAYVRVTGVSGDLQFCSHHYDEIMNTPAGYEKMMAFMYTVIDERERLINEK